MSGLDAKIMRVGNLMARNKDGEFQINAKVNRFLGRLRAYHAIGCFPYSSYYMTIELVPIDCTIAAVLRLARTSGSCRVFHPYNNHTLFMGDIILIMKDFGISIEMVEDYVFQSALSSAMKDLARAESTSQKVLREKMVTIRNRNGTNNRVRKAGFLLKLGLYHVVFAYSFFRSCATD